MPTSTYLGQPFKSNDNTSVQKQGIFYCVKKNIGVTKNIDYGFKILKLCLPQTE